MAQPQLMTRDDYLHLTHHILEVDEICFRHDCA